MGLGSFAGGFSQSFGQAMQQNQQRQELAQRQAAGVRAQQLEQMRLTNDLTLKFKENLPNIPEEMRAPYINLFLNQWENASGQKVDSNVRSIWQKSPEQAISAMVDMLNNANGQVPASRVGGIFANSAAMMALMGGHFAAKNADAARNATAAGAGAVQTTTPGTPATPTATTDYRLTSPSLAPSPGIPAIPSVTSTTQTPTPGPGDLGGMQIRLSQIDNGIKNLMALQPTTEINKQIELLQGMRTSLVAQQTNATTNPMIAAAQQMGIPLESATPAQRLAIQQQAATNAGQMKQFEATGTTLGTPLPTETAALRGMLAGELYSALPENAPLTAAAAKPAAPGIRPTGVPPTAAQVEETKGLIQEGLEKRKTLRKKADDATALLTDFKVLEGLQPQIVMGTLGPATAKFNAIAKGVFNIDSPNLAPAQVFAQITNSMGLRLISTLQGSATEKEEKWILEMNPRLASDPNAMKIFIGIQKLILERQVKKEQMLLEYQKEFGIHGQGKPGKVPPSDFEIMYKNWADKNDMSPQFAMVYATYSGRQSTQQGVTRSF